MPSKNSYQKYRHLYARAFCNVFSEKLSEKEFFEGVEKLQLSYKKYSLWFSLMSASTLSLHEKQYATEKLTQKLNLLEPFCNLLQAMVRYKVTTILPGLIPVLIDKYKKYNRIFDVQVSSCRELTKDEKQQIKTFFDNLLHKKTKSSGKPLATAYTFSLDTELIAGIKIQTMDFYYEDSIAKKLKKIEIFLTKGSA